MNDINEINGHIIPTGEKVQLTRMLINNRSPNRDRKILKVVGASWFQTRVSSYIIAAMSLLGIITIIMGELGSRYVEDGNYSATVFWRQKTNFKIEFWGQGNDLKQVPSGAARAYFRPDVVKNGWSVLEIETSPAYPDWVQAYAAGLLEGSLTWQSIYFHWKSTVENACVNAENECEEIRLFLKENEEVIRTLAVERENDPYWHQIRLFYAQLDGLETGWRYAVKRAQEDIDIPSLDFLWLNTISDLNDLKKKFNFPNENFTRDKPGFSSSFIKISNTSESINEKELYITQNTAAYYNSMLRILKRYQFNFHILADPKSSLIPGTRITFTGYPGAISSHDDFYTITSNEKLIEHHLIVTGTTFNIFESKLWSRVDAEDLILLGPRVMAANRLATNPEKWSEVIRTGDIGSGNKHWMVVDLIKFKTEELSSPNGLLWLIEQIPGKTNASDISQQFIKNGYWATFGIPYHKYMKEASGYNKMEEKFGIEFSFEKSPKAKYFEENHNVCNSFHDSIFFMRNITEQPSATDVALRGDLLPENPEPYGTIDTKAVTISTKKVFDMQIISGPPHSQIDDLAVQMKLKNNTNNPVIEITNSIPMVHPFKWSSSAFNHIEHIGQPDVWSFQPVRPIWIPLSGIGEVDWEIYISALGRIYKAIYTSAKLTTIFPALLILSEVAKPLLSQRVNKLNK